jgi:CRP-like cAMP-binding protein
MIPDKINKFYATTGLVVNAIAESKRREDVYLYMQEKLRQHFEKLIPLTDDEFAFVMTLFTLRKFKKHQFLIQQGDAVDHSYFVVSGLLKLSHTDANDKKHILYFAKQGRQPCMPMDLKH